MVERGNAIYQPSYSSGETVIGICLGSQLIAAALGAKVYPNEHKEIGWFDISLTKEGKENPLLKDFDKTFKTFHWHGDTFDIPEGSHRLFQSAGCRNQAFLYKEKVLGLQFHFEVTLESLHRMIEHGRQEMIPDKFVQTEEEMLACNDLIKENNQKMYAILNKLEKTSTAILENNPS